MHQKISEKTYQHNPIFALDPNNSPTTKFQI